MNIPDDYDGTDAEGEPICDCPTCGVLPWTWENYERTGEVKGLDLFLQQITWHWFKHRHNYGTLIESAYHKSCLQHLFAYRRSLGAVL